LWVLQALTESTVIAKNKSSDGRRSDFVWQEKELGINKIFREQRRPPMSLAMSQSVVKLTKRLFVVNARAFPFAADLRCLPHPPKVAA
jgi:hypothetical protein